MVEIEKFKDYCLSTSHPRGRHKARVFATAPGLPPTMQIFLRTAIPTAIQGEDAIPTEADEYGQRFIFDFSMEHLGKQAAIRSSWMIRTGEDFPRLTSCYVL